MLYYDSLTPVENVVAELHFRRCILLQKASEVNADAEWFVWIDTDVFVQQPDRRIEDFIDLNQPEKLYHLFHERPLAYPVNTGVKIVHRDAIHWEGEIYGMRDNCPFPYEQKVVIDHIIPKYEEAVTVNDPRHLNCIYGVHDMSDALFVHMCGQSQRDRDSIAFNALKDSLQLQFSWFFLRYCLSAFFRRSSHWLDMTFQISN